MLDGIYNFLSKRRRDKLEQAKLIVEFDEWKKRFLDAHPNVVVREGNPLANYFYLVKTVNGFEIYFVKFGSFACDRIANHLTKLQKTSRTHAKADFLSLDCLISAYKELERI